MTLEELEAKVTALEALIGTLPEGKNTIVGYVDEVYALSDSAMNESNEALITAEAAMAKASSAEQMAFNGLMFAQQADDKVTQLESNIEDVIQRAEDAAKRAETAAKKIGNLPAGKNTVIEYIDEVKATAEAVANAPEYKLPYTAAEFEAKLSKL